MRSARSARRSAYPLRDEQGDTPVARSDPAPGGMRRQERNERLRREGVRIGGVRRLPYALGREVERTDRPGPRPGEAELRPGRPPGLERRRRHALVLAPAQHRSDPRCRELRGRLDQEQLGRTDRVPSERREALRLQGRLRLLQTGVREHRLQRRPGEGARAARKHDADQPAGQQRLPSDRPRDRPRGIRPLPRQCGASACKRLDDVLVGLLPRRHRARVRRRPALEGGLDRAQPLYRQGDQPHLLPALPVRPRPRARADDLQPQRPAVLAPRLRRTRDGLGPELLHGRRLHAELPAWADAAHSDQVGEQEGPPLPL